MAIEPVYGASITRTDPLLQRRNENANAQQLSPQVLQMMQRGRETSALLSTLPGPSLSFFQPPAPPQAFGGPGQGAGGLAGTQPKPNVPLLEAETQGRVTSALLSPLMGTNERAFQAPTPPAFAGGNAAAGAQAAAAPLPRAGAQLLETEQTGRTTSRLLSGLMGGQQPAGPFGPASLGGPAAGNGQGGLAAMRAAEEVIQAVGTTAPSPLNMRIANDAYQMEAQAQQQSTQGVTGQGKWEWFA